MKYAIHCCFVIAFMFNAMVGPGAHGQSLDSAGHTTASTLQKEAITIPKGMPLNKVLDKIGNNFGVSVMYRSDAVENESVLEAFPLPKTPRKALSKTLKGLQLTFKRTADRTYSVYPNEPQLSEQKGARRMETVSGTVTDDSTGQTLPGVNIKVKGTTTGTSTGKNGHYSLSVPSLQDTLVFSYIGYKTQTVPIGGRTTINVTLRSQTISGQQMVVVGYGKQKKISVTSAISSIPIEKIKQSPTANIGQALAGRLPGLIAVQHSGEPGNDFAQLHIRGYGTFNTSAQNPLILVDGVERSYNETFRTIDPHTIKNITVLKDASATAIYGVRGANGVILITTKNGHEGPAKVNLSYQRGVQTPTRLPDYAGSYEALKLYQQGLQNDGNSIGKYTNTYINKFKKSNHNAAHPAYKYLYPNINWVNTLLKQYAPESRANLNISGGTSSATYYISGSYYNQKGIYKYANNIKQYNIQAANHKYNFRAKSKVNISKNLQVNVNLGGVFRRKNYPNTGTGFLFERLKATPAYYYPLKNPNGSIPGNKNKPESPYSLLTKHGYSRHFGTNTRATAGFNLKMPWITKGLNVSARFTFSSFAYRTVTQGTSPDIFHYSAVDTVNDLSSGNYNQLNSGSNTLSYGIDANQRRRTKLAARLKYQKNIRHNSFQSMLYFNRRTYIADVGSGSNIAGLPHKIQGLVGRLRYSYKDRYYAEFNFGYNGSENFRKGHRYGFFPSLSFAWVASDEPFIKNNIPFLSLLKFRFSAGVVGNDQIGARFLYQSRWVTNSGGGGYDHGYHYGKDLNNFVQSAYPTQNGNPNSTWERAKKYNLGLNINLFKSTIGFKGDVYYQHRTGILTTPGTIPDITGIRQLPEINVGVVDNKGIDFTLKYNKSFAKQLIKAKLTYTFAKNHIVNEDSPPFTGRKYQDPEGKKVSEDYGLIALGLFKNQEEINNSPRQTFGPVIPGDIKYKDRNGDGIINSKDAGYLGTATTPESQYGFSITYGYKNLRASVLFQGALGGHTYYNGSAVYPFSAFANVLAEVKNKHWTKENPNPHAKYPVIHAHDDKNNYRNSTFWLRENNYVRVKNAEIAYNFPKAWLSAMYVESARIFINGENLLTFSKLKLFDPEAPNGTGAYPQQKVYNIGVHFNF